MVSRWSDHRPRFCPDRSPSQAMAYERVRVECPVCHGVARGYEPRDIQLVCADCEAPMRVTPDREN